MSEIRKDPFDRHWVVISRERSHRPSDLGTLGLSGIQACPFCPGQEKETPPEVYALRDKESLSDEPGWKIRVIPNKYPALVPSPMNFSSLEENLFAENQEGRGLHEVLIETHHHCRPYSEMEEEELFQIFESIQSRFSAFATNPAIQTILLFKNHGARAGASLAHPHSQLIGLPMIPKTLEEELERAETHYTSHQRCIYCHLIEWEHQEKKRIVLENSSFVAFVPYASRTSFEIFVAPKKHGSHFSEMTPLERGNLSALWKDLFMRLQNCLRDLSYNYFIHTSPLVESSSREAPLEKTFHWHIEILPRLGQLAGFEWGSGFFLHSVFPEEAAHLLRQGKDK